MPALAPGRCEGSRGIVSRPRCPALLAGRGGCQQSGAGCPAQAADILEGNSCSPLLPVVRSQRNGRPGARLCRLRPPRAAAGLSWGRTPERGRAGPEPGECGCRTGHSTPGSGGPWGGPVRTRGRCGRRGGCLYWGNRSPSLCPAAAPGCHSHRAWGPSGGRIVPWRDLAWGRPPWRAAGHLPPGPAGGRSSTGWGSTGTPRQHHRRVQGPALRPQARPALTWKRSRVPGGAEKPRVRVYCGGRRSGRRAAAAEPSAAPLPREDAAPETPGLREHRAKGSAGAAAAEGLRGSGAEAGRGGLQPEPFAVVPPGFCLALGPCLALQSMGLGKRLLSGAVPAPGQGCPSHEEVLGLAV